MLASGRLTARLIVDGALSFAFVPVSQLLALIVVTRLRHARFPSPDLVRRYFAGNAPWLWWLCLLMILAAVWVPFQRGDLGPILISAPLPIVVAAIIDRRFLRDDFHSPHPVTDAIVLRLIAWTAATLYFIAPNTPPDQFLHWVTEFRDVVAGFISP